MKNLITAIYAKYAAATADNIYTSTSGRLYYGVAKQDVARPFIVFELMNVIVDVKLGYTHYYADLNFAIYTDDVSPSEAVTIGGYLKTFYDDCSTLSVTGYTQLNMQRGDGERIYHVPHEHLYQNMIPYNVLLVQ